MDDRLEGRLIAPALCDLLDVDRDEGCVWERYSVDGIVPIDLF